MTTGLVVAIFFVTLIFLPKMAFSINPEQEAKKTAEEVEALTQEREKLQSDIKYFDEQINFLAEKIAEIDTKIKENEERLVAIHVELNEQQNLLSSNLRILYKESRVSFLERLLTARTLGEIFSSDVYFDAVRSRLIENTNKISELKKEEESRKKELEHQRLMQEIMRASLALEKAESKVTLERMEKEELIIREKFARMLTREGIEKWCAGEREVIKAKHPVFRFPVECGYISQGFGNTIFASIERAYGGAIHNGFDVGVRTGTPIYAIGNGEVFARGRTPSGGWGNWIMIRHDPVSINSGTKDQNGNYIYNKLIFYSLSAHMVAQTHLRLGERVTKDTVVGFVGGTPNWAPHLHLSLFLSSSGWSEDRPGKYPGNSVDPLDYMNIPISTVGTDWDARFAHF